MSKFATKIKQYEENGIYSKQLVVALLKIEIVVSRIAVWIHWKISKACRSQRQVFFLFPAN